MIYADQRWIGEHALVALRGMCSLISIIVSLKQSVFPSNCSENGQVVKSKCAKLFESKGVHMNLSRNLVLTTTILVILNALTTGCGDPPSLPPGAVGNPGNYNYSPSVIETGNTRKIWWCSPGVNPNDPSQDTDSIYYQSINMSTHASSRPVLVLAETPGAWDSAFTCNPKVIGGVFENPLGDGQTYTYAMYYVATPETNGLINSIGVAFSNDGILWNKYPQPIIPSSTHTGYGVGQPALYNADHKSEIYMFYEDTYPTSHHVAALSTDGVHFTVQGTLTFNGLDPDDPNPSWGDMAYDSKTGEWYAIFDRPTRPMSTTGGVLERGPYGVELYKIPQDALLTGSSPWQQLATMDTNSTGFEQGFLAGLVRDLYGNINVASYPTVEMYTSISYPPRAGRPVPPRQECPRQAQVGFSCRWSGRQMPAQLFPLIVISMEVCMRSPPGGLVRTAGFGWRHFSAISTQIHSTELRCHSTAANEIRKTILYRSMLHVKGSLSLGKDGYAFPQPVPGLDLVALYRCRTGDDHFVSKDPKCEGQTTDKLLGYVVP